MRQQTPYQNDDKDLRTVIRAKMDAYRFVVFCHPSEERQCFGQLPLNGLVLLHYFIGHSQAALVSTAGQTRPFLPTVAGRLRLNLVIDAFDNDKPSMVC